MLKKLLEKLKKYLEVNDIMQSFFIGLILGLMCFFVQLQFELPIETWFWIIGIICIIYMGATAFIPALARFSFGLVGFLVGIMISLFIWTFLSEIQNHFSLIIMF